MRPAYSAAAAAIIALLTSACEKESATTVTTVPPPPASATTGSASATPPLTTQAPTAPGATSTTSAPADYNAALEHLQQGAQRLRDAVQAMAKEPAGARRNEAIKEAHAALINANSSMSQLYQPQMGSAPLSPGASGTTTGAGAGGYTGGAVYPKSDAEYTRAMENLLKAAQRFRESIQSMAQLQPGPQRDQAIKEAHQALSDTTQAMIQLPPEMRTEKN